MVFDDLYRCFTTVVSKYCRDEALVRQLFKEIADRYSEKHRHYHNLHHLHAFHHELLEVKDRLRDWDSAVLSMFYHDIIYDVMKQNNEERSAALAHERLSAAGYPRERIDICVIEILATKGHLKNDDEDVNYFTDCDLSILGSSSSSYQAYAEAIRREYYFYADQVYRLGRRKVLQHFLMMERIYKTEVFYSRYEHQARSNILNEMRDLE